MQCDRAACLFYAARGRNAAGFLSHCGRLLCLMMLSGNLLPLYAVVLTVFQRLRASALAKWRFLHLRTCFTPSNCWNSNNKVFL